MFLSIPLAHSICARANTAGLGRCVSPGILNVRGGVDLCIHSFLHSSRLR